MTEFRCQVCNEDIPGEHDLYYMGGRILCLQCAKYYLTTALEDY